MKLIDKIKNMSEELRTTLFVVFIGLICLFFFATYQYNQEKTEIVEKLIATGNYNCHAIELLVFGKVYRSCLHMKEEDKWQNTLNLTSITH